MQDKNDAICLLYTTYHSFLWDLISDKIHHKNLAVVNFSKRKIKNNSNFKIIERTERNKTSFVFTCLAIALKFKFKKFDLFLPHPDHLLGNTLFFSKTVNHITILEDGILNYYNYERADAIEKIAKKRRLITWLTPFRYKLYTGHHSGIDSFPTSSISGWFTAPEKIIKKEKFRHLNKINFPVQTHEKNNTSGLVIVLDQPLEKFISASTALNIREKTILFVENNFKNTIVKAHPEHESNSMSIKNELPFHFDSSTPIEEIILTINPEAVVSFCSTALINISKISQNIRCIAIGIDEISKEVPGTIKIKNIFSENNIEIY